MMKDTVLITGGSGLLAVNWARCIKEQYNVVLGMHRRMVEVDGCKSIYMPLSSVNEIVNFIKSEGCKFVVHAAAMTSVEQCEEEAELAEYTNVKLSESIAIACQLLGVSLVYISTDQLFQGDQKFMKEDDLASPVNIYGKSKSKAEKRVLELNSGALVVRTNFYGWGMSYRRSFSDMIIDKLRCNESVVLFKDVYFTPILIDTLVSAVHCLLELKLSGVFNVGGNDRVSKYDFGIMIAKMFSLKANLIVPGYLSMRNDLVQRPFDMSLSNQKLNNLLPGCTNCLEDDLRILRQSEIK